MSVLGQKRGQTHLVRSFLRLHRPLHRRSLGKRSWGARRGLGDGGLWPRTAWLRLGQGRVLLLVHPSSLFYLQSGGTPAGRPVSSEHLDPHFLHILQPTTPAPSPQQCSLLWSNHFSQLPRPRAVRLVRWGVRGQRRQHTSRAHAGLSAGLMPRP